MRSAEVAPVLFVAALLFAAIWPLRPADSVTVAARQSATVEWAEAAWVPQDTAPRRLPLSAREQGFARQFPGHIARFADSRHEWIVRVIDKPTRMLHPATDCFRGLGYTVTPLRVCERIFDAQSGRWTDASSWYWSALLTRADHTMGPWWAVTRVEMEE